MDKVTEPPVSVGGGDMHLTVQSQLSGESGTLLGSEISPKAFIFVRGSKQADP